MLEGFINHVRSFLGPRWTHNVMAPMTGVTIVLLVVGGWVVTETGLSKETQWIAQDVLRGIAVWMVLYFIAYMFHAVKDPRFLQSEGYRLDEKRIAKNATRELGEDTANPVPKLPKSASKRRSS